MRPGASGLVRPNYSGSLYELQQLEYVQLSGGYGNRGYKYKISYWDSLELLKNHIKQPYRQAVRESCSTKAYHIPVITWRPKCLGHQLGHQKVPLLRVEVFFMLKKGWRPVTQKDVIGEK